MVTAKVIAIIAVILSALLTIKQQHVPSEVSHAGNSNAADVNFNFSHYDLNKILDNYGR